MDVSSPQDVSSSQSSPLPVETAPGITQDNDKPDKERRWRQIVERERDHQGYWRDLLHKSLFSSPESKDEMMLDLPQIWAVTENDTDGKPDSELVLRAPICKVRLCTWPQFNSFFCDGLIDISPPELHRI